MNGSTPKARAISLRRALDAMYVQHDESTSITHLLTDLRHLCDAEGHDFAGCDDLAYDDYRREIEHPRF